MKRSMFITAGLMFSLAAGAQKLKENDVPAAVKDAFKQLYFDAKDVKWEKEGGNYEAEFEVGESDQAIVYNASGQLIETEMEISVNDLPSSAKEYVSKNYKNAKIKEGSKIADAKGNVTYEAEIKGKDLIFDSNGKFIREERDKSEHKD